MDQLRIRGGKRLDGKVPISGAKNAVLPLMAASLLSEEELILENVPDLADMRTMSKLLQELGITSAFAPIKGDGQRLTLTPGDTSAFLAPYELVCQMRASVLVLGPLVAARGEARVSLPGGCAIGTRPIDLHLKGLEALGAEVALEEGYVHAKAPNGLTGTTIRFPFISVGATENLVMAAALAKGETLLENAAREPEVDDLANCLVEMGAKIRGIGTETLRVEGVLRLSGTTHQVIPDRIEAGTYAVAAAITGGTLELVGARADHMGAIIDALRRAGATVDVRDSGIVVSHPNGRCQGFDVMSAPYPGFPTDMQAQFMALMSHAAGASLITETIFENRFMHVPELARMGADVTVHGASAMVRGGRQLRGAPVMATDLRASVSLVLAALAAEGETTVNRLYHLDRGYENLVEKLKAVGADIERIKMDQAA